MPNLLVTGGARGIGRATAILAAQRGWSVAVNYLSDEGAARRTVAAVEAHGRKAAAFRGDVSDEAAVVALFDSAEAALGPLDAVAINAGIVGPTERLAEMEAARLRRGLEVNLYGSLLSAREAARRMGRSGGLREDLSQVFRKLALHVLDLSGADALCDQTPDGGENLRGAL